MNLAESIMVGLKEKKELLLMKKTICLSFRNKQRLEKGIIIYLSL